MRNELSEIPFTGFPKIARYSWERLQILDKSIFCCPCGNAFTMRAKARSQKYCSRACRHKTWTNTNRVNHNANVRAYRRRRFEREGSWRDEGPKATENKRWMTELKSKPCTDCNNCYEICCMDFDHRPGTEKVYNVGSMFAHHYARELIEVEIAKCDLVCSNCHRIRTRDRSTGKRNSPQTEPKGKT